MCLREIVTASWAVRARRVDEMVSHAVTLAAGPGAIAAVVGQSKVVGVTEALTIDLDDLESKLDQADVLLLSHMRGHICDMDRLMTMWDHGTAMDDRRTTMLDRWTAIEDRCTARSRGVLHP